VKCRIHFCRHVNTRVILLPFVILITLCVNVFGEKGLFLGVEEQLTYDSNIHLSADEVGDLIITSNPNAMFKLSGRRFSFNAYYGFEYFDYLDNTAEDYYAHIVKVDSGFKVLQELEVGINYEYSLVPIEIGLPRNSPVNLLERSYLRATTKYRKEFSPRRALESGIEWVLSDYPGRDVNSDYWELKFPLSLTQKLDRLLSAGIGYTFLIRNFNAQELLDYNLHHATIDSTFDLNKLKTSTKIGYEWLDYRGSGFNSGPVVEVDIKYDFTRRTKLNTLYSYSYSADARGNPFRGQHAEILLNHRLSESVELTSFSNLFLYKMPGINYKIYTIEAGASIDFKPSKYINFGLDYLYSYNKRTSLLDETESKFDIHRAGFTIKLNI